MESSGESPPKRRLRNFLKTAAFVAVAGTVSGPAITTWIQALSDAQVVSLLKTQSVIELKQSFDILNDSKLNEKEKQKLQRRQTENWRIFYKDFQTAYRKRVYTGLKFKVPFGIGLAGAIAARRARKKRKAAKKARSPHRK